MKLIGDHLFKIYAKHFYDIGLNICYISNEKNENNFLEPNLLKAPANLYKHLFDKRQTIDEFNELKFDDAVGIGIVLGFDNVIAIDIDGCVDFDLINFICKELDLPIDYKWLVKSGSLAGFHIILKLSGNTSVTKEFGINNVDSFYPNPINYLGDEWNTCNNYDVEILSKFFNNNYTFRNLFQKIEFGWKGFLVLPPSIHSTGNSYEFLNGIPVDAPIEVDFKKIKELRKFIASKTRSFSTIESTEQYIQQSNVNDYEDNTDVELIFFDTETNGLPIDFAKDFSDTDNWPNLLQLSWLVVNSNLSLIRKEDYLIQIGDIELDKKSKNIHGFTTEKLNTFGFPIKFVLNKFLSDIEKCKGKLVSHNFKFDSNIIKSELLETE